MKQKPLRRSALMAAGLVAVSLFTPIVTPAQSGHDLQINIVASQTTVVPGTDVTFTMTIKNNGPLPSVAGNVKTGAPAGTQFVSVDPSVGTVDEAPPPGGTGDVIVSLGGLSVNQTETVTLVLTLVASPGSSVTVESEVQGFLVMGDPNQSNNKSEVHIQVVAPTMADLAFAATGEDPTAGSGSLFTYTMTVTNPVTKAYSTRDTATGVGVVAHTPSGAVFAAVSTSQGSTMAPPVGQAGIVVCNVGALEEGATATVSLTVNIVASPGSTLNFFGQTSSDSIDPNTENNFAEVVTPVVDSGAAMLEWEPPVPPTEAQPLPPPQRLEVTQPASSRASGIQDPHATLQGYNVYRANTPGVTPSPGTFFMSVPPDQTNAAAPVAPGGSFFTVTAMYDTGESAPSNEGSADVPAATLTKVKVKSAKIQATGNGFSEAVTVFVDGIPFVSAAVVKKQGTKVIQKGNLLTGQSIGAYLAANPSVLISFRNSNGGVVTYRHPQ